MFVDPSSQASKKVIINQKVVGSGSTFFEYYKFRIHGDVIPGKRYPDVYR
jgi:hypothetical protein